MLAGSNPLFFTTVLHYIIKRGTSWEHLAALIEITTTRRRICSFARASLVPVAPAVPPVGEAAGTAVGVALSGADSSCVGTLPGWPCGAHRKTCPAWEVPLADCHQSWRRRLKGEESERAGQNFLSVALTVQVWPEVIVQATHGGTRNINIQGAVRLKYGGHQ